MSEPAQAGKTCDLRGIREAVCVHTGKITDSCLAKDCIEDLRVYLTRESQALLDASAGAKARCSLLRYRWSRFPTPPAILRST